MVSINSSTKQQHKTERKHCVADWLLRPCDPKWHFPTIFNCWLGVCWYLCVDIFMYRGSQGVFLGGFAQGLPRGRYLLVRSAWSLLFPVAFWMLTVISWSRWSLFLPIVLWDSDCYFLVCSRWSLLFLGVLWMVTVISWCALDGHCYFLVRSGWSLLFPGALWMVTVISGGAVAAIHRLAEGQVGTVAVRVYWHQYRLAQHLRLQILQQWAHDTHNGSIWPLVCTGHAPAGHYRGTKQCRRGASPHISHMPPTRMPG